MPVDDPASMSVRGATVVHIREWINQNATLVTVLAIIVLVLCFGILYKRVHQRRYAGRITAFYYYDIQTDALYADSPFVIPPIDAPSGPGQGVRAYVFSCGECPQVLSGMTTDELEQVNVRIGWLEKYDEETRRKILDPTASSQLAEPPTLINDHWRQWDKGHLIKAVDDEQWVVSVSEQGMQLMRHVSKLCPENKNMPKRCLPPQDEDVDGRR